MIRQASVATTTAGKPSRRNRSLHGAIGPVSPSLMISQARDEAKVVASGAAVVVLCQHLLALNQWTSVDETRVLTRDENRRPQRQLLPPEEEAEIDGDAREPSLPDAQQEPEPNQPGIRHGDGLQRRHHAPGQHDGGHVDVRGDDRPQQREPLEGNVRNVEGREGPLVISIRPCSALGCHRIRRLEILVHPGHEGIAYVYL